jgi:hypothetical protein
MKVKILEISRDDSYYEDWKKLIGKIGDAKEVNDWRDGWQWCSVEFKEPIEICGELVTHLTFYEVRVEEVK